ncbi:MAG TPA: hypothetical protein VH540_27025 [Ktedonobacterales bacterium]|jgi:hypothetical protein
MPTAECDLDGLLKNSREAKVDQHGLARYSETPLYSVGLAHPQAMQSVYVGVVSVPAR